MTVEIGLAFGIKYPGEEVGYDHFEYNNENINTSVIRCNSLDYFPSNSVSGKQAQFVMDDIDWINYTFDLRNEEPKVIGKAMNVVKPKKKRQRENSVKCEPGLESVSKETVSKKKKQVVTVHKIKKKKTIKPEIDMSEIDFKQGRWKEPELALLLHIARDFISKDLKVIGDIAIFCGIHRPRRAIDKQLKRMLKYERWVHRDKTQLQFQITYLLESQYSNPLTVEQKARIQDARRQWEL